MALSRPVRATAAIVLIAFCSSCATTRLPPITTAGDEFQPLKDERRLWERSRDEESTLRDNVTLYQDPLLQDYLEEIVGRLNPQDMAANPQVGYRVTVLEDPTLNAFAFPHGSLYVHTGLLARMENEDQLATVLGHEMTHVEYRHMLRYQRSARNKQLGFGIGALAAAIVLAGEEGDAWRDGNYGRAATIDVVGDILIGLGLQLALIASVNGYGRDLEREADAGGFEKMAAVGYDLEEAPKVYEALLEDHGDSTKAEAFFFGNHPRLASRIESAKQWLIENPTPTAEDAPAPVPAVDRGKFLKRIRPVLRDDARLNIEAGRLKLAEDQLERVLGMMPEDPETHMLIGRLRVRQADAEKDAAVERDLEDLAAAAFREAIRLDPDRTAPHRELGLLAYRTEDFETACVQFRQYVELDPGAEDAARMRDYALELELEDQCP